MSITIINKKMSIKLRYLYINFLFKLLDIPLHGEERRERDKFLNTLSMHSNDLETERKNLIKEYSKKDEKGESIIKSDKNYDFTSENLSKFQDEFVKLLDVEFIIDVLDSNRKQLKIIKNLLINTNAPLNFEDSKLLEEIVERFDTPVEEGEQLKLKLNKEDLENNPELKEEGLKEGDEIEIPKETVVEEQADKKE